MVSATHTSFIPKQHFKNIKTTHCSQVILKQIIKWICFACHSCLLLALNIQLLFIAILISERGLYLTFIYSISSTYHFFVQIQISVWHHLLLSQGLSQKFYFIFSFERYFHGEWSSKLKIFFKSLKMLPCYCQACILSSTKSKIIFSLFLFRICLIFCF